jgi:hypothetical protein
LVVLRENQQDRGAARWPVNNGRFRSVRTTSPQVAPIRFYHAQNARLAVLHRPHPLLRPGTPQISRMKIHPSVPPQSTQKNSPPTPGQMAPLMGVGQATLPPHADCVFVFVLFLRL